MVRKSERPTMPPDFDVAKYAKDSDAHAVAVRKDPSGVQPSDVARSETRLATRPSMAAAMTDESWARSMTGAPVVVVSASEVKTLPLDHRAGFLLSRMDGYIDLDTLVELSAMRRADALRLVRDLCDAGVVEFH